MKISKRQLRRIIRESILREQAGDVPVGTMLAPPGGKGQRGWLVFYNAGPSTGKTEIKPGNPRGQVGFKGIPLRYLGEKLSDDGELGHILEKADAEVQARGFASDKYWITDDLFRTLKIV
jgi:hypothetical protein